MDTESLVPKSAYEKNVIGYFFWRVAVCAGTLMASAVLLGGWLIYGTAGWTPTILMRIAAIGFASGVVVAAVLSLVDSAWRRCFARSIHAGTGLFKSSPPNECSFPYRLHCSLWRRFSLKSMGVLYLGPTGVAFVPYSWWGGRLRQAIRLQNPGIEVLSVLPVNGVCRLVLPWPERVLGLRKSGARLLFIVPRPDDTIERVRQVLGAAS